MSPMRLFRRRPMGWPLRRRRAKRFASEAMRVYGSSAAGDGDCAVGEDAPAGIDGDDDAVGDEEIGRLRAGGGCVRHRALLGSS